MNNLWKFKRYLTLDDVADYLSSTFNDEVQRIDVERFLLDGHMAGSVIANDWHCFILNPADACTTECGEAQDQFTKQKDDHRRDPDEIINGAYRIDLAELQSNREYINVKLKNGCKATCYAVDYSKYERVINESDTAETNSSNNPSMFDRLILGIEALPKIMDIPTTGHAYVKPTIGIENIVIQPSDLEAFIANANDDKPEKPLDDRERRSMELIILALAKIANYDLSKPYKAAEILQAQAASLGIELPKSISNISGKLSAAHLRDTYNRKS
jgi:hypothetical protein